MTFGKAAYRAFGGKVARLVVLVCWVTSAIAMVVYPLRAFAQPGEQAPDKKPDESAYQLHMTNGVKLFNSNDFTTAIAEFDAAYKTSPKASPLINQALCYRELKKYPKAVERLELALAKHSDTMTPEDKEASKKAIADMRALFAYVTIAITPEDAAIEIDGEAVSKLERAQAVAVSPGEHEVSGTKEGFLPASKKVSVASSDRVTVDLALAPARGTLRVIAAKPDTMIEIDGKSRTTGSWQGELPAGSVMVRAVGETGAGAVEIVAGKTVTIDLSKGSTVLPPLPTAVVPNGPRRGFYGHLNGAVLVPVKHPKIFADLDDAPSSGGYVGVRAGYRVHTYAAFEGMLEYGNVEGPANGAGDKTYSLSSIRIGPALRLMSPGELVKFVGTLGGGLAIHLMSYEDLDPATAPVLCVDGKNDCESNGVDFYVQTEVGVEIDFDHVLIGGGLALYLSGTKGMEDNPLDEENVRTTEVPKPYDNEVLPQIGPRVYIGYAFW
ncbi:MAG: PEGA domain-containing protein [Polyangiaceae bacterium]|nr:PEGA domain-containing protein [Polyangiaceae bacterium]